MGRDCAADHLGDGDQGVGEPQRGPLVADAWRGRARPPGRRARRQERLMRQRLVILTRPSAKRAFVERYGSEGQTRFVMAQSARGRVDFDRALTDDTVQSRAVAMIRKALPDTLKLVEIDRAMV